MNHPLKLHAATARKPLRRDSINPPAWPSFTGTSQLVGTSPGGRATIYVDPALGAPGLQNAQDLLNDADRVASANDVLFGTTGGPVSVIVFALGGQDRKSTRLNSSHVENSYAVFCLKKK